jgi:hypothetical protein
MASPKRDHDYKIHRMDTEPPPPGGDAYGAVTKVGPLSKVLAAQMMCGIEHDDPPAKSGPRARTTIRPAPAPNALPWIGDEEADATLEPTMLNGVDQPFVDRGATPADHAATAARRSPPPMAPLVSYPHPSIPMIVRPGPSFIPYPQVSQASPARSGAAAILIASVCVVAFMAVSGPIAYLLLR